MTILFFLFTFIALNYSTSYETHAVDVEVPRTGENEFAEFEVADEPKFVGLEGETKPEIHLSTDNKIDGDGKTASNKRKVAETTEEFPFVDDEQFEQISSEEESNRKHSESGQGDESIDEAENEYGQHDAKSNEPPKPLTFAEVPSHFRSNWSSYQVEIMALIIISLYSLNYLYGKSKNHAIAYKWFSNNRERLEKQFALVGDDGTSQENLGGCLIRETDFSYSVWCTGRIGCQGMHSQIKLYKRQDLLGMTINLFRPHHDRVIHSIELDRDEMDSFVIVFGQRKNVQKLVKEMHDLTAYVTERKNLEKIHIPSSFCVFAEIAETVPAIIDASTIHFLKKCEKYVEYIHLSDQYAGAKQQDDQYVKLPETHPTLVFSYFLIDEENDDEGIDALLFNFTFFILDKIRKYRLSKEGKAKADKKRQNVQENFLKLTHQQRQEAAQTRREEKTRERKQRVMEEEDPNRQKRLEKLELKRDAKQKQPKMKQFKIK